MRAIHQFVAGFSNGDAISNEARVLRNILRAWGHPSEIFCELKRILPELRNDARDLETARATIGRDDVVLLHLSIGSRANDVFAELDCRKAILYHNITPPEYFRGVQEEIAHQLRKGLDQARALAGKAQVVMADSRFNAAELEAMGHRNVRVFPLFLDQESWRGAVDRRITQQYKDGAINILFVGRCAPNKCIEDLLFALYYFQKYVEPRSRLIHAGSYSGLEQYYALLRTKAIDLKLKDVVFTGSIRQNELNALYGCATMYLSMSEHEGFGIPLIEAMAHGIPVLAYSAAAVPETMDGAGILFSEKRFDLVAEMMGRLATDTPFRQAVLKAQRDRIERYVKRNLEVELRDHLVPLLSA